MHGGRIIDEGSDRARDDSGVESFTPAVREKLKSYVYLLVDPRTGRPFHVDHGRGDRCFDHVQAARIDRNYARAEHPAHPADDEHPEHPAHPADDEHPADEEHPAHLAHDARPYPEHGAELAANGDFAVLERIRRIESAGRPVRVEILRYGLSSDQAAVVATAAHELLGLPGEPPARGQRSAAAEVQARLTKRAKFKRSHQVVLLRVGPTGTRAPYEEARHGWRVGRRWVHIDAPRSPRWAVMVIGETVDSVYRLDRWEPWQPRRELTPGRELGQERELQPRGANPAPGGTGARLPERYSFVGTRDAELERRYVGKSVAPYLGKGSAGSVAYVWCGPHWVNTAG